MANSFKFIPFKSSELMDGVEKFNEFGQSYAEEVELTKDLIS